MTHRPETGACFWRRKQAPVVWCQKPWHTYPANDTDRKKTTMDPNFTEIRFFCTVLRVEKHFRHSTSSFVFVYKQTSSAIVCSDWPITVQLSRRFPARNWTCSNRRRFLAPEKSGTRKVWQTDQFLVPVDWYQKQAPETGQCDHY